MLTVKLIHAWRTSVLLLAAGAACDLSSGSTWRSKAAGLDSVFTDVTTSAADEVVEEAARFRTAVLACASFEEGSLRPVRLILYRRQQDFAKVAPEGTSVEGLAAYTCPAYFGSTVVLCLSHNNTEHLSIQDRHVIRHEMVHALYGDVCEHQPRWFREGFAEYLAMIGYYHGFVVLGRPNPDAVSKLQRQPGWSLADLLEVDSKVRLDSAQFAEGIYASGWAFAHYCLHSGDPQLRGSYFALADLAAGSRQIDESMIRWTFGCTIVELQDRIASYLARGSFQLRPVKLGVEPPPPPTPWRLLSSQERDYLLTEIKVWSRLPANGAKLLRTQHAGSTLDGEPWLGLAFLARRLGDKGQLLDLLVDAASHERKNSLVYAEAARLAWEKSRMVQGPAASFWSDQAKALATRATQLEPRCGLAKRILGEISTRLTEDSNQARSTGQEMQ